MGLEEKVGGWIDRARDYIALKPGNISSYLREHRLNRYFEGVDEEERRRRESLLADYVNESVEKYDKELGGIGRRLISKPSMTAAVVNDIYSLVSKAPIANFSAVSYVLFGAKTLSELPSVYKYLKKSHDWYGAAVWALMKPVNYLLPIVGPMIESGSFERMVKRRVMYEAQNRFLERMGAEGERARAKKILKRPIREFLGEAEGAGAMPAYA